MKHALCRGRYINKDQLLAAIQKVVNAFMRAQASEHDVKERRRAVRTQGSGAWDQTC